MYERIEYIADRCDSIAELVSALDARLRDHIPTEPSRLYTRKQAAEFLGVTTRTVDRRINAGELEVVRQGRTIRIVGVSLDRLLRPTKRAAASQILKI